MSTAKWYNPSTSQWEYVTSGFNISSLGNVTGPVSSTYQAVPRFSDITGKQIQNSGVEVDDSGNMVVPGSINTAGMIECIYLISYGYVYGRINPRNYTVASLSSITPSISDYDQLNITALAANLTINAPTGSPIPASGNKIMLRIKDNGTSRTLTWDSIYRAMGVTIPTATTASKTMYVSAIYNSTNSKWDVIAVSQEA